MTTSVPSPGIRSRWSRTPATIRSATSRRVSAPVRWDEVESCEPRDFTIDTMPARYAELGDLHHDIDDHVFDIAPLLEWADRDGLEADPEGP